MDPLLDVRAPSAPTVLLVVEERGAPGRAASAGAAPDVAALVGDLRHLPGQRPALLRVIQLSDDPDCSVRGLAEAAALDPAFTARLLQLANSAYYGRRGQVSAIGPAVAVLGADTVRGLAVTMALGLSGEHGALPDGFAVRSATAAAATRLLAPRVGADAGDAFCVGLLHEVGAVLLFRATAGYAPLLALDEAERAQAERAWCGMTSHRLAAEVLGTVGLPVSLCSAIAAYPEQDGSALGLPLARALRAGVVLARAVAAGEVDEETRQRLADVVGPGLDVAAVRELALRAAAQAAALSASLG